MIPQLTEKDREKAREITKLIENQDSFRYGGFAFVSLEAIEKNISTALAAERQAVGEAMVGAVPERELRESHTDGLKSWVTGEDVQDGYNMARQTILTKCKELGIEITNQ